MIYWEKIYYNLIERSRVRLLNETTYYEKHHIIPRYMGGDNTNQNLVHLTFREHILAHYILWRIYNNIEDKIAYKMMSGQTEEGRILKQQLAVKRANESNRSEILKEIYKDKNKVEQINAKRKATMLKNNNGQYYSEESKLKMKEKFKDNYEKYFNPESLKKRSQSLKKTIENMSNEEFYNRYIKPMEGPLHPMYGKKRPGDLAGNYGKSKGVYTLITPDNEEIEFSGIKNLMKYGINELTIRKWTNKGKIEKDPKCNKPFKWVGYEIKFIENENYGIINKSILNRKQK
jgi:hypothetical protein